MSALDGVSTALQCVKETLQATVINTDVINLEFHLLENTVLKNNLRDCPSLILAMKVECHLIFDREMDCQEGFKTCFNVWQWNENKNHDSYKCNQPVLNGEAEGTMIQFKLIGMARHAFML